MYVIHIQTVQTTTVDSDVPVTRDGEGLVNIPCVLISTSALKELTGDFFLLSLPFLTGSIEAQDD